MIKTLLIKRLERYFVENLGVKHIILTGMGRTAITVALRAFGVVSDDEVIIPAFICPAVERAVRLSGAKPVFADVNENSFSITIEEIEKVISPKTKGIIINHTYGFPADTEAFRRFCDERGVFLIEDCVSSYGNYDGNKIVGDIAIFSLYKIVVNTGGGFIATNDSKLASQCKLEMKSLEKETNRQSLFKCSYTIMHNLFSSLYEVFGIRPPLYGLVVRYLRGFHGRQMSVAGSGGDRKIAINMLECILAYLQLPLIDNFTKRYAIVRNLLAESLKGFKGVAFRLEGNAIIKSLPVFVKREERDKFIEMANNKGLNMMTPWLPLAPLKGATALSESVALFHLRPYFFRRKIDKLRKIIAYLKNENE